VSFVSGKLVTAGYGQLDIVGTTTTTTTATATTPATPCK
jgi:hypothetical protein